MVKRTFLQIMYEILNVLSDGKIHSLSNLEKKVNTNWQTIRLHCKNFELFEAINKEQNNSIKITLIGLKTLNKLEKNIEYLQK